MADTNSNALPWKETTEHSLEYQGDIWMATMYKDGDPNPWVYVRIVPFDTVEENLIWLREEARLSFVRRGLLSG